MQYIPINKDLIPYSFEIVIGRKLYSIRVFYNYTHDFFTVDLIRNGESIVLGEKVVYGIPLFINHRHLNIPKDDLIIPLDLDNQVQEVTWDSLQHNVYLYLFKMEDLQGDN